MRKGQIHSEQSKLKMVLAKKGVHVSSSTEFKKGIVPWNKGLRMSNDMRKKLSVAHIGLISNRKGCKLSENHKLKISLANKGNHHTETAKNAISMAMCGRVVAEETKKKLSLRVPRVGWKHTEESKEKINKASCELYSHEEICQRRRIQMLARLKKSSMNGFEKYVSECLDNLGTTYEFQFIADNRFAYDFKLDNSNILIECDCGYWHNKPRNISQDHKKTEWAKNNGFKLVRINYETMIFDKSYVVNTLNEVIV